MFKPAGISSERAPGETGDSLARRAQSVLGWERIWLPHRLDRPTRGLIVVAGSQEEAARCSEEIRTLRWTKWYIARVPSRSTDGRGATELVGAHRAYLKRAGRLSVSVRSGGDPARLEVLATAPSTSSDSHCHALIRLDTGRYHQIRVMLATLGFPLVGDTDYGAPARPAASLDLESIAIRMEVADGDAGREPLVHRLAAHPDRRDVDPTIEAALDRALAARQGLSVRSDQRPNDLR